MALKNRLTKLEKVWDTQPAQRIDFIEIHKTYDDGREVIEVTDLRTARPSEILRAAGELMNEGAQTTEELRRAMDSKRQVTYEQP
jgi:hypothetical protein